MADVLTAAEVREMTHGNSLSYWLKPEYKVALARSHEQLRGERDAAVELAERASDLAQLYGQAIVDIHEIEDLDIKVRLICARLDTEGYSSAAVRAGGNAADALRQIADGTFQTSGPTRSVAKFAREALASLEPAEEQTP